MNQFYLNTDDPLLSSESLLPNLDDARFLSGRFMPSDALRPYFFALAKEIYSEIHVPNAGRKHELKLKALVNILVNLYKAHSTLQSLIYSRACNHYSFFHHRYGYNWYSYNIYIPIIDALLRAGIIRGVNGFYHHDNGHGFRARMWCSEILAEELLGIHNRTTDISNSASITNPLIRVKPNSCIILKNAEKKWINYSLTKDVIRWSRLLTTYNEMLNATEVLLPQPLQSTKVSIDSSDSRREVRQNKNIMMVTGKVSSKCAIYKNLDCRLYRVFNRGQFYLGGRYYDADHQTLNKEQRKTILINGTPVVEADFKALHATMLYNTINIEYDHDPYDLFNGDQYLRSAVKLLFTIAINAKGSREAIYVFNQKLTKQYDPCKCEKWKAISTALAEKNLTAAKLYAEIVRQHEPLKAFLSRDMGVKLQFKDSLIATDILAHFLKRSIPCLPVHDSFLIPVQYEQELIDVMQECYKRHMHFNCAVEVKKCSEDK